MGTTRDFKIRVQSVDPMPVGSLLTHQAALEPDAPAYTIDGITTTRAELDARSNRRARAFQQLGVSAGDFVSIALPNGLEFHETTFAVWKLGAIPAPVSHKLPETEIQAILKLVNPKLIVGFGPGNIPKALSVEAGFEPGAQFSNAPLPDCPPQFLKATTSGGSTGRPKVIVDHKPGMVDPAYPMLGMTHGDTILNPAPLYHNAPFGFTNMALCYGLHVVEMRRFAPLETLRLIEKYHINWLYLVPTMMNRIMQLSDHDRLKHDISSLDLLVHMAASCPVWLKQKWIDWLSPEKVWEVYAGTEGLGGTIINGREWEKHKGSVGRVDRDVVKIVSESGEEAGCGSVGEIYFKSKTGPASSYHYIGATPRIRDGWESYGDMGSLDEDDYLYVADRRTDMIVSGGANIYPAEIEAALDAHPAIGSSVIIGLPDDDLGHRGHAIIQVQSGFQLPGAEELEAYLAGCIARHKIPYTYEIVTENLRDDAGKVRRSKLREDRLSGLTSQPGFQRLRA